MNPYVDRVFWVEKIYSRGEYGKAYGKCIYNGQLDDSYGKDCSPQYQDGEIPCAGCGEWVLIDAPDAFFEKVFRIHKPNEIIEFGKYNGKSLGEIYEIDAQYLLWLVKKNKSFRVDFSELKNLYPNVKIQVPSSTIMDRIINFGKFKGKKYSEIKNETNYLKWLVSINKLSSEEFSLLTENE